MGQDGEESRFSPILAAILVGLILLGALAAQTYTTNQALQSEIRDLNSSISSISASSKYVGYELNQSQTEYEWVLGNSTRTETINGDITIYSNLSVWGLPFTLKPGFSNSQVWAIPDTFEVQAQFVANKSIMVYVMDLQNMERFFASLTFNPVNQSAGTNINFREDYARGCALYFIVVENPNNQTLVVRPNVRVSYAPTPDLTGYCSATQG